MTIVFENVGPEKKSWEAVVDQPSLSWLNKQVRKHGALMSRDIEYDFDSGSIYVGMFRKVGEIRVKP